MSEAVAMGSSARTGPFDDDHEAFRESFRTFCDREVVSDYPAWRSEGIPRELFAKLAEHQFVGARVPEEQGGAGIDDFRFGAVILEEAMRANAAALALELLALNEICVPLLAGGLSGERRDAWLAGIASGETIVALASPDAPLRLRGGEPNAIDGYAHGVVNGRAAEVILAVAAPSEDGEPALVAAGGEAAGLRREPSPELVGPRGCDRADIAFEGVEPGVAASGDASPALANAALTEQVGLAVMSAAGARRVLAETLSYVHDRRAFGRPIAEFENTRFALGAVAAEAEAVTGFVHDCVGELAEGTITPLRAAAAKLQASEAFGRAVDWGVQLHGGYGYMLEYPIAHSFADARFLRLHGGTSEQMKGIVADGIGV
jgi:acyl-CoA dehydrogenase